MSPADVLNLINEHGVKFVDLRFTDTIGKEQHVSIPAATLEEDTFTEGKCLTVHPFQDGKALMNRT